MPIILEITDGATTLELDGSASDVYGGVTYFPDPPNVSATEALTATTSETITAKLEGTSAEIVAGIQAIERLIRAARRRQAEQSGIRVYLHYAPYTGATAVRSEILDGRLVVDSDPNRRQFSNGVVMVAIDIERRAFWEATSETTLGSGSITNNGAANHLNVTGVGGVVPAPAKITLTAGAAVYWARFYVSCNAWNDPAGFASNLAGASLTWSDDATHGTAVATWTLAAGVLNDTKGDWFHALACFGSSPFWAPADATLRLAVRYSVTDVYVGDEVYTAPGVTRGIYDLGALPLPPGGWSTANAGLTLALSVRAALAGQSTLSLVQLMPAAPGRFRRWEQIGYEAGAGDKVIDDPYEGIAYLDDGGARLGLIQTVGEPLLLWPGQTNRITVLFDESNASTRYVSSRTSTLAVAYRPRYLSV